MDFTTKIAHRYLFAKKTSAIRIISGITISGIAIGVAALLFIMSIFNGLEGLIASLYNSFNPEIKITIKEGKVFDYSQADIKQLQEVEGVAHVSRTLEEIAFYRYKSSEHFGVLKGVDESYKAVTHMDSSVVRGSYKLKEGDNYFALLGIGAEYFLDVNLQNPFHTLQVFLPKRKTSGFFVSQAFAKRSVVPSGVFVTEQEIDEKYVLSDLRFVQNLLAYDNDKIGAIEISLTDKSNKKEVKEELKTILGDTFNIKDQEEQEVEFYRLIKTEKWIASAITSLFILLIALNLIGTMGVIVLEKRKDIAILKSMGTTQQMIKSIFLKHGLGMTLIGIIIGLSLGGLLIFIQKTVGIIRFPDNGSFVVRNYPIEFQWFDGVIVFFVVLLIGWLAILLPANRAANMNTIITDL